MSIKERLDPHLLKAASASAVATGKGAHALLEAIGSGTPKYRLLQVTEWVAMRETASGASWRVVAGITSTGEVTEL